MIKLSELSTEDFLNKVCDLTPHLFSILTDKELVNVFNSKTKPKNEADLTKFVIEKMIKLVPLLLKEHKDDILSVLAIMSDRTLEDIKKQNAFITIKELKELFTDKDLVELFLSLQA